MQSSSDGTLQACRAGKTDGLATSRSRPELTCKLFPQQWENLLARGKRCLSTDDTDSDTGDRLRTVSRVDCEAREAVFSPVTAVKEETEPS